jgi:2-polyprenyl-6-methoxyphenol hydroxylase-like FAD-dependent oxidoreductase
MSLTTPTPKLNILISGAGIAGTCLAYWLSKTTLNTFITVLERSPVPRPTGQSVDIRGPAISIIKKMGLEPAVRACSTTEEGTRLLNTAGNPFAEFGKGDAFTADYEILRADLCGLFLDATEKLDNVKYIYGDYVTGLDQTEKSVSVTLNSGRENTYDLVIAADGSTSKIRSMILDEESLKNSYRFIGQYTAYFSIPSRPTDTKHWYWYNAPNNNPKTPKGLGLMTRPHRNPETIGVYMCITKPAHGEYDPVVEQALKGGVAAQKKMLHVYFENAGWQVKRILAGMDHADDFYMSRSATVHLPKWHNNRTVLLGDAAFATFGIGTSLAIESAYFLAGELSKIQSGEDVPQALAKYEEAFRKIQGKDEELPPGFPQIAFPSTSWGLRLRNTTLWLASKTKVYKLLPDNDSEDASVLPEYKWVGV